MGNTRTAAQAHEYPLEQNKNKNKNKNKNNGSSPDEAASLVLLQVLREGLGAHADVADEFDELSEDVSLQPRRLCSPNRPNASQHAE